MGDAQQQQQQEEDKINNNVDILVEILTRLDGKSLAVASCVCRLWSSISHRDSVWETLCNRHVSGVPGTRGVVLALGGYRRLYRLCLGPALDRLNGEEREGWAHLSLSLSLSLFSIDCYERLGGKERPASLLFLCKPVNVA